MVYATVSKGFRPGASIDPVPDTLCADDLHAIGLDAPSTSYTADTLWNYELGAKLASVPLGLSVDAAAYYVKWSDLQQTVALPTCGFLFTGNFGTATSKGAELELRYDLSRTLRVAIGGAYNQAQLTSNAVGAQGNPGDPLQNAPKWTGNASIEYHQAIRPDVFGFVRFDASTSSRQYNNFVPTSNYYASAGYSLANARLGFETSQWKASLFINNLLDKRAETALPLSYAIDLPVTRPVSLNRPRTFGIDVRRDF